MIDSVRQLEQTLGRPVANASFAMMQGYIRSSRRRGIGMLHTARPFDLYRKIFFGGRSRSGVLRDLQHKTIVDIGCGYTPYARDSMFRACHDAGIEFYGVDPLIGQEVSFGLKEKALAIATGGAGKFSKRAPGLDKAISAQAQNMPFDDASVDEILCCFLLFVWINDEVVLKDILQECLRVLKPGGSLKLFPLRELRFVDIHNRELNLLLEQFSVEQTFIHGYGDIRVMPAMLTKLTRMS
ncbi:MAG: class I SAM-dependent methyltransferase [Pseudomonadota bacterium]